LPQRTVAVATSVLMPLEAAAGLRDGRGKRIEIHGDEIDRVDAVLLHDRLIDTPTAEQRAMDQRCGSNCRP
jgi:hypothetical protein